MGPKFSIVIPTVDRLDLLRRALYSALCQRAHFDDYEIVVLDNCSEDGTWEYLQSLASGHLRPFRNPERLSQGANWNRAVRLSSGEFVYMLEDDNVVLPEMLARLSRAMARHTDVDLVCFAAQFMSEDEREQFTFWQPEREEFLPPPQALLRFAALCTTSASHMVFARAIYDRHGAFDESHTPLSDTEYILRWMVNANTLLLPDILAMHRLWSGTLMATKQYTPEMVETLTFTIDRVVACAAESGRLEPEQVEQLHAGLAQWLLVDFLKRPVEDVFNRP